MRFLELPVLVMVIVLMTLNARSATSQSNAMGERNPFFSESQLPHQMPPFDRIQDEHYAPAFERGMADQLDEVEAIATDPEAPTFENTVVALERSGRLLARVDAAFSTLSRANTTNAMDEIRGDVAPRLAIHDDQILLNSALFERIKALYERLDDLSLDEESRRLVDEYHTHFVRAGAELSESQKTHMQVINAELASLETVFTRNVLDEVNASAVVVESRGNLIGLSEGQVMATAVAARERDMDGQYVLALLNTSGQPIVSSLKNRALRERITRISLARGSRGGDFDNRHVVSRMARLRAERAQLLGYPHHAAYMLEEQTARTVEAVNDRLAILVPPAVANAEREASDLQATAVVSEAELELEAWDWAYYTEQVRAERFNFDATELRPYLEMWTVLENGVFFAAHRLFGLAFEERPELPLYDADVRVWEVFDRDDSSLGIFIADYYARPSKRGGAWMDSYVSQSRLLGTTPVIANHLNVTKPVSGASALLTFDEVETMFHEFGHTLHGLLSDVRYPYFSGTSVPRDFVEYPSQVNEMWATWPEVLRNYAVHHETDESMPAELVDKVLETETFNQGFATTEYLAASLLDQAWHQLAPDEVPTSENVVAFETATLTKAGIALRTVPPRYRSTYFSHIWTSGYSAGYYSYIWSEVLVADTVEWFKEHGGLTRENGDHFRRTLLSRGGSRDAMGLYRDFRGGDPDIRHLLMRRGLADR